MKRIAAFLLVALVGLAARAEAGYEDDIEAWRTERQARLRADDGWLTVAGLFWLEEGQARFGTAPDNEVVFPDGPALAGTFVRQGKKITVKAAPGVALTSGGKPITEMELVPDSREHVVALGRLRFFAIARGGRYGIRLRDLENPPRKAFTGTTWFPVRPKLRVEARFVPHEDKRTIMVPNILGDVVPMDNPGRVVFRVGGRTQSLEAVVEEPGELFIIFSDGTSGKTTYPGGRFLYSEMPKDGVVTLDFNKAYSPPCAFTPFATCPLPPKPNRLKIAIEAGEKYAGEHH